MDFEPLGDNCWQGSDPHPENQMSAILDRNVQGGSMGLCPELRGSSAMLSSGFRFLGSGPNVHI